MNAIIPASSTVLTFADIERLGSAIAGSGLFGIKTREQAIALMMIAQAEGRHPALAARDYDVIQGRPSKKSEAMLRDFLEGGGRVKWHKLDDTIADATFTHQQGGEVRITWDMKRATAAGLGGKDNWKKFPRQMLRSRCVSEGVRTVWPTATSGLYEPGEVADFTGPTIDIEQPAVTRREANVTVNTETARERVNREVPLDAPKPQRMTVGDWLSSIEIALRDAGDDADAINRVLDRQELLEAPNVLKGAALTRFLAMRDAARAKAAPFPPLEDEELPEVEIVGESKVFAG